MQCPSKRTACQNAVMTVERWADALCLALNNSRSNIARGGFKCSCQGRAMSIVQFPAHGTRFCQCSEWKPQCRQPSCVLSTGARCCAGHDADLRSGRDARYLPSQGVEAVCMRVAVVWLHVEDRHWAGRHDDDTLRLLLILSDYNKPKNDFFFH